jgi:type I restriction-modification system DNA methylase subunit/predicted DNA-binding transcriptional regulator AlpA
MSPTVSTREKPEQFVTASEVARLCGVQPSAVSNWRKRFADFPRPVGTAPSGGDLFRRAEIDQWLRRRGRIHKPFSVAAEQLWAVSDRLRGTATAGALAGLVAVAAAFIHLVRREGDSVADHFRAEPEELARWVRTATADLEVSDPALAGLFGPLVAAKPMDLRLLLDSANSLETASELAAAVDAALDRGLRYGEFQYRTPEAATNVIVELARARGIVLDPAAGSGEFLIRAASHPDTQVFGEEINEDARRIGVSRLLLRGVEPRIALGDSLVADAYEDLRADIVMCDPPAGVRLDVGGLLPGDPRWRLLGSLEAPSSRAADFAWLGHVIHHLKEDGRGYVLLPPGTLFHGGAEARFRAELLRQGTIEAVVALPVTPGTVPSSSLWIVRPPTSTPADVLLIEAQEGGGTSPAQLTERIAKAVGRRRDDPAGFEPTPGFATTVSVLELLSGDASLLPSRWVSGPELLDPSSMFSAVRRAIADTESARTLLPAAPPSVRIQATDEPPERFRVGELIEHGLASLIRPARLRPGDFRDEGLPVWVPTDVRPEWERDEERRFADPAAVDQRSITQPGDIVFTTIGDLRARVDREGGHVLGTSLHGLRLDPKLFDSEAVAALLASEQNRGLMGGTIPRVNIRELQFPRLDPEAAVQLRDTLQQVDAEEQAGRAIAEGAAEVRAAVIDAVAAGVAVIEVAEPAAARRPRRKKA